MSENSRVSAFHKRMITQMRDMWPDWNIIGWPETEVNLGHLAGLTGCNLFADAYVEIGDGRAFVVEFHSTLHDPDTYANKAAWGDEKAYYARMGRDKLKRELCSNMGLELCEVWPSDKTPKLTIMSSAGRAGVPDTNNHSFDEKKQEWKPRKSEWKSEGFANRKTEWKNGDKLPGSSFKKRG